MKQDFFKDFPNFLSVTHVPLPPGPPVVTGPAGTPMGSDEDPDPSEPMEEDAAAVEDLMIQNEGAAAAEIPKAQEESVAAEVQPVQDIQEMDQDLPGIKKLASQRQAAVFNLMDPRKDPLVPYVSISSDESSDSDSEGKRLKSSKLPLLKCFWFQSKVMPTR